MGSGNKHSPERFWWWYARGESNPNRWNRNPLFYPLNYGRIIAVLILMQFRFGRIAVSKIFDKTTNYFVYLQK